MSNGKPGDKVSLIMTPITYEVMEFVRDDTIFGKQSLNERLKEVLDRGVRAIKAERK